MSGAVVTIVYRTRLNKRKQRRIVPMRMWWGRNRWHPEEQYLLDAWDCKRNALRTFAMSGITEWRREG